MVSSTYLCTKQSGFRSLISTKNERGPNQEPVTTTSFSFCLTSLFFQDDSRLGLVPQSSLTEEPWGWQCESDQGLCSLFQIHCAQRSGYESVCMRKKVVTDAKMGERSDQGARNVSVMRITVFDRQTCFSFVFCGLLLLIIDFC